MKSSSALRRGAIVSSLALVGVLISTAPSVAAQTSHTCNGLPATLVGTSGNDVLVGTDGKDVIVALGGNDTVDGLRGSDVICGGSGDDTLIGGRGHDVLVGDDGKDRLEGNRGRDDLYGGAGSDVLLGGKDPDRLWGNNGADTLNGNNGADELRGGKSNDTIVGGNKADKIWGGDGDDYCDSLDEVVSGCEDGVTPGSPLSTGPSVACNQADIVNYFEAAVGQQSQSTIGQVRTELIGLINQTRSFCGLPGLTEFDVATENAQEFNDVLRDQKNSWINDDGTYIVDGIDSDFFDRPYELERDDDGKLVYRDEEGKVVGPSEGETTRDYYPWFAHGDAFLIPGYTVGENLGFNSGTDDVTEIHLGLVASVGHFCNIVNPAYDLVGIGATTYSNGETDFEPSNGMIITEHFAGRSDPASGQTPSVCR